MSKKGIGDRFPGATVEDFELIAGERLLLRDGIWLSIVSAW